MKAKKLTKSHLRGLLKNIAFFGDAALPENDPVYKDAYEIARLLAEDGYTIVNGGGPGVMNAATQGASSVGGETISVTFEPKNAPGFEGRYVRNITTQEIKTTNYIERMFKLLEHADMFIIFKGGSGTMSEFGTAWVLGKLYYGCHKPMILYGHFWEKIISAIKEGLNIDKQELDVFRIVTRRGEVIPTIEELESRMQHLCKLPLDHLHKRPEHL